MNGETIATINTVELVTDRLVISVDKANEMLAAWAKINALTDFIVRRKMSGTSYIDVDDVADFLGITFVREHKDENQ